MSPFYIERERGKIEEGKKKKRELWTGEPIDIRQTDREHGGVSMYSVRDDPEQVQLGIGPGVTYVRVDDGTVFFPEKPKYIKVPFQRSPIACFEEVMVVNRRGFRVIDASTGKTEVRVVYRARRK